MTALSALIGLTVIACGLNSNGAGVLLAIALGLGFAAGRRS